MGSRSRHLGIFLGFSVLRTYRPRKGPTINKTFFLLEQLKDIEKLTAGLRVYKATSHIFQEGSIAVRAIIEVTSVSIAVLVKAV